jgi:hypothetical protein
MVVVDPWKSYRYAELTEGDRTRQVFYVVWPGLSRVDDGKDDDDSGNEMTIRARVK